MFQPIGFSSAAPSPAVTFGHRGGRPGKQSAEGSSSKRETSADHFQKLVTKMGKTADPRKQQKYSTQMQTQHPRRTRLYANQVFGDTVYKATYQGDATAFAQLLGAHKALEGNPSDPRFKQINQALNVIRDNTKQAQPYADDRVFGDTVYKASTEKDPQALGLLRRWRHALSDESSNPRFKQLNQAIKIIEQNSVK